MLDLKKALVTSTASGAAIIPEKLDPILVETAIKETPLITLLKEMDWTGIAYQWNERSALNTAAAYDEADTFSSNQSTYGRKTVTIKMVKSEGAVSNILYETSKSYIDSWQAEIESATKSAAQEVERLYIEGNATANTKEFDGLSNLCTQTINAACSVISLDLLDQAIDAVQTNNGKINLFVMNFRDLQKLHKIMRDKMLYAWQKVEVAAGVYLTEYRGIPLYGTSFIPTNLGKSGSESYVLALDTSRITVPVVKNFTYEDLTSRTTTDARAFRVKTWRALAVKGASKFHVKITNVLSPTYGS